MPLHQHFPSSASSLIHVHESLSVSRPWHGTFVVFNNKPNTYNVLKKVRKKLKRICTGCPETTPQPQSNKNVHFLKPNTKPHPTSLTFMDNCTIHRRSQRALGVQVHPEGDNSKFWGLM